MVHKSGTAHESATPRLGARVLAFDRLTAVTEAARRYAAAIAANDAFKDAAQVAAQLNAHGLNAKAFVDRWTNLVAEAR